MTESALAPTPPPVDSPRVLVVDDDNEIREILRITLESEGYQVAAAETGEAALEAVGREAPALVILDARLPGRDGFDICRTLKSQESLAGLPVIMISANSEEESRVRGLKAGATDFLAKPFYPRELLTKVYNALQTAEEQTRLTKRTSVLEEMAEKQRQNLDRTERKLKKHMFSSQTLMSMCHELTGSLKPEELLNSFMLMVLGQLGASSICLMLPADNSATVLIPRARKGVRENALLGSCVSATDDLGKYLSERNRPAEIEWLLRRPGLRRPLEPFFNAGFQVIDPVAMKGQLSLVVLLGGRVNSQPYEAVELELLSSLSRTAAVALENANLFQELQDTCLGIIRTLLSTLEAKDTYTRGHTERVAMYSVTMAEEMGIKGDQLENIRIGATLHDIGKLGVMDKVLNKPAALDREERQHIMSHPARGAAILDGIRFLEPAVDLVRHHHEYIDGTGYPDGLVGDEISIGARIVAVADAFDAMTSGRVYMQAMSVQKAIEALRKRAGKQWDPKVIDALERVMQRGVVRVGI
jgi:putative nucleotidyltransferase with HDIG domain